MTTMSMGSAYLVDCREINFGGLFVPQRKGSVINFISEVWYGLETNPGTIDQFSTKILLADLNHVIHGVEM